MKKSIIRILARLNLCDSVGRKFYNPRWGYPDMHGHAELENDLFAMPLLSNRLLTRWFHDRYSTSKHLWTLYSIAHGLRASKIIEIGFGRTSFILARAASELDASFTTVDQRDFSYLLSKKEKLVTEYIHGKSDLLWSALEKKRQGVDMFFLDYFSGVGIERDLIIQELANANRYLKQNGIICVHDTNEAIYKVHDIFHDGEEALKKDFELLTLPYCYGLGILRKKTSSEFGIIEDIWQKK